MVMMIFNWFRRRTQGSYLVRRFVLPVERSQRGSRQDAKEAVKGNMHLSEYLPHRLATYAADGPQDGFPLPLSVSSSGGRIVTEPNPEADRNHVEEYLRDHLGHAPLDATSPIERQSRFLRATNATEANAVLSDLAERERERTIVTEQHKRISERRAVDEQDLHRSVADGSAAVPATTQRTDRGRLELSFSWLTASCWTLIVVLLLGEAYQFALPYFDSIGIDSSNLAAEWVRNPIGISFGACFAIGAAAIVFVLAHWLFARGRLLYRREGDRGHVIFNAALLVLTALAITAVVHRCAGTEMCLPVQYVYAGV